MNAHFLQCRASSNASVRVLQTATYNHNFMVLLLFRAEFHKIGQLPTASGVLLMVSRITYLFQ